jgi:predicted flap endonuclease-1-like 5' DNA nuclease
MTDTPTPLPAAIGRPATRAFAAAGLRTLDDLAGASERALLALHGVGPRAIKVLREHGVTLAP